VRATSGSVVSITTAEAAPPDGDAAQLAAAALAPAPLQKGTGSGFVIREDGLVLTNAHVVEGARSIQVALDDVGHQLLPAELLGLDPETDIALLRIRAGRPLRALPLGESDRVQVGQWVVAQGSPFGLAHTVSAGIVSYVGRSEVQPEGFTGYRDYLQTDAAINPGSSGGPLLDLSGRVVGIVDAVNPAGQGIAFALPIDMAKRVLPALLRHGRVRPSWLGVRVQDLTAALAESFGLHGASGVVVADLDERGPAARSGLRTGDLVLRFDGRRVRHAQHLRWLVEAAPTDRAVPVVVRRRGLVLRLKVRAAPAAEQNEPHGAVDQFGARFAPLDVPAARAVGLALPNGARVLAVLGEGPAHAAGLRAGDVVTRAGDREVAAPEDLGRALLDVGPGPLLLHVHRGAEVLDLELPSRH
jgi:serine protease Do